MVVRLPIDAFSAGDMVISVRRRFRPSVGYLKQFYPSGSMTMEAKDMVKKFNRYKDTDQYFSNEKEVEEKEVEEKENRFTPSDESALKLLQQIEEEVRNMRPIKKI
jgi:hypothetical protein